MSTLVELLRESVPQSNQRGIETRDEWAALCHRHGGLNRTSVGLKRQDRMDGFTSAISASIEPAWD